MPHAVALQERLKHSAEFAPCVVSERRSLQRKSGRVITPPRHRASRSAGQQNKRRLADEGKKWDNPPFAPQRPQLLMDGRKAPMRRLITKLGLGGFRNVGPMVDGVLETRRVGIPLKQHVGSPCQPTVSIGGLVRRGDCIGKPPLKDGKPALGARIHASIDGKVAAIGEGIIWIEK